jgi:homoserine kinase
MILQIVPHIIGGVDVNHTRRNILGHRIQNPGQNHIIAAILDMKFNFNLSRWFLDQSINKLDLILGC